MKSVGDLSLSTIFRFGLTGLVALALFVLIPIAVFAPAALHSLAQFGGAISVLMAAFAFGFVIDGLKLYQLSKGYEKRRAEFNQSVAKALGVDLWEAPVYFAKAAQIERQLGLGHIDLLHSRWVTFDVCAKVFLGAAMLWSLVALGCWIAQVAESRLQILLLVAVGCLATSLRMFCTARQERIRASGSYVSFCRRHRELILGSDLVDVPLKAVTGGNSDVA